MAPRRSTQAGTSQEGTQKRKKKDDEDEEEDDEDSQGKKGKKSLSAEEMREKAGQMVRLALFNEYKRLPLRRDIIAKQILPNNPRLFNDVLEGANQYLKQTMGMELVELRMRNKGAAALESAAGMLATQKASQKATQASQSQRPAKVSKARARLLPVTEQEEDDDDEPEGSATQATQTQKGTSTISVGICLAYDLGTGGSKTYILRSVLPIELVAKMNQPAPLPYFPITREANTDEYEAPPADEDSGALLRWEKGDGGPTGHIALLGIRTVILCLIICLDRVITDDKLHAYLRRLHLHADTPLPYTSPDGRKIDKTLTLDRYLDLLVTQNYLEKIPGQTEPNAIEWRWGNREAEFSEKAAAAFIEKIFFDMDESEDEEEEEERPAGRGNARARGPTKEQIKETKRQKLRVDLVKAAGSELGGEI